MSKVNEFLYPDADAGEKLIKEFGDDPYKALKHQDWEYIYPNLKDLDKYLNRYNKSKTTKKEKRVLASFIFQVCDDLLSKDYKSNENKVREILKMLYEDVESNKYEFNYWSLWETEDKEDRFYIAEITREFNVKTDN